MPTICSSICIMYFQTFSTVRKKQCYLLAFCTFQNRLIIFNAEFSFGANIWGIQRGESIGTICDIRSTSLYSVLAGRSIFSEKHCVAAWLRILGQAASPTVGKLLRIWSECAVRTPLTCVAQAVTQSLWRTLNHTRLVSLRQPPHHKFTPRRIITYWNQNNAV